MNEKNLSTQIRAAVVELLKENSLNAVAKKTGIPQPTLHRFVKEKERGTLSMRNIEKLWPYLNMQTEWSEHAKG